MRVYYLSMNSISSWVVAPILVFVLTAAEAATLVGHVVGVDNGDTITVLDASQTQHKIRLAGIDAPELEQAFGNRSKQSLSHWVYGRNVTVEWTRRDRHQRIVGKVWVVSPDSPCQAADCPKTLDAGLAQITVGLAWHDKQYEREQSAEDRGRYSFAEYEAKAKHAGLWAEANPVPPWEWCRARGGRVGPPQRVDSKTFGARIRTENSLRSAFSGWKLTC